MTYNAFKLYLFYLLSIIIKLLYLQYILLIFINILFANYFPSIIIILSYFDIKMKEVNNYVYPIQFTFLLLLLLRYFIFNKEGIIETIIRMPEIKKMECNESINLPTTKTVAIVE